MSIKVHLQINRPQSLISPKPVTPVTQLAQNPFTRLLLSRPKLNPNNSGPTGPNHYTEA